MVFLDTEGAIQEFSSACLNISNLIAIILVSFTYHGATHVTLDDPPVLKISVFTVLGDC